LKKLKVCPLGFSFGRHLKLSKLGLVQGRRQGLLPGLVNSMETVGSKDGSIKRVVTAPQFKTSFTISRFR
jgi:hypothetical protein